MEIQQKNIVIATTTAVVFLTTVGYLILRRRNNKSRSTVDGVIKSTVEVQKAIGVEDMKPPTKWIQIATISGLHIYPMKSGRAVNLTKADATKVGLQEICRKGRLPLRDRIFVVYRETDKTYVSGKTYNKMLKLTVNSVDDNNVELSLEKDRIIVKVPENKEETCFEMRKEIIPTLDCGDEVGVWISKMLLGKDKGFRVGYWPGGPTRDITEVYSDIIKVYKNMCNDFMGAYSDISSYLIVNQSSVDDLNIKINDNTNRVTPYNFRPNIVVEGAPPYSEDEWTWIKIGDEAIFRTFKPCTRCSVTTVDPETLEKSLTNEPLKTLKSYRLVKGEDQKKIDGNHPVMGMYMGLHTKGRIKFGDPVYVSVD